MQNCCSPIASASAAAPRAARLHRSLQLLLSVCGSAAARRLCPLQLLLSIASVSTAPRLIAASASAAAPRLRPLRLLLPDCVRFDCSSPIASNSTAASALRLRPLRLLLPASWSAGRFQPIYAQCSRTFFAEFGGSEVRRSRITSLVPAPRTSHFRHAHTS